MSDTEQYQIVSDEAEYPFVIAPMWILLSPTLKPTTKNLYLVMRAHVNTQRAAHGDTKVWPARDLLAQACGLSRADKIDPYITDLEKHGLVTVKRTEKGKRHVNLYTLRMRPPKGWQGPLSLEDICEKRGKTPRPPDEETAGQPVAPISGPLNQPTDETPGQLVVPNSGLLDEFSSPHLGKLVVPIWGPELDEVELDEFKPPLPPHDLHNEPPSQEEIKSGEKAGEKIGQPQDQPPQSNPGNDQSQQSVGDIEKAALTFMELLPQGPNKPTERNTAALKAEIVRLMREGASPTWIRSRVAEARPMGGVIHFFTIYADTARKLRYTAPVKAAVRAAGAPAKDWQAAEGTESRAESLQASQAKRERIRADIASKAAKLKELKEGKRPQLIGAR